MSTLSCPASVSQSFPPAAPSERFGAEVALFELAGTVRALRLGLAPFDVLHPAERAEQLAQLVADDEPAPDLSGISNDELIELVGNVGSTPHVTLVAAMREIDRRLAVLPTTPIRIDDGAPDAAERQIIEDEDFREHTERTMAGERAVTLDTPLHGRTGWPADEHPHADAFGDAFGA